MKQVTYQSRMLLEADSLFALGDFPGAKSRYEKIRTSMPKSDEARTALYKIAYSNIYYRNAHADWGRALEEFKSFVSLYPNDPRADEAYSLIRLLTVIRSFDSEFSRASSQVGRLKDDRVNQKIFIESIETMLQNCYRSHDSLARKNANLESVILDLEKKCQQAGQ
jgi:outer membrane protein assembly factor BamD (BamD/ComL family)